MAAHYLPKYIVVGVGILYIFLNCGVFQCGLCDKSQEGIKIFEPFLYCKKAIKTSLNFWLIGTGSSLKLGTLAGLLRGFHSFFTLYVIYYCSRGIEEQN